MITAGQAQAASYSDADDADGGGCDLSDKASKATGGAARRVLRFQFALLTIGFIVAFILGALAPTKGHISSAMALPEWNDRAPSWDRKVNMFASRIEAGFGIHSTVALEFSPWILEASLRQDLAPELLAGLVLTESSFRKNVTSPVGAIGPAQVRPDFWSQYCGTADLADPAENIYCGAQVLAYYVERCGAEDCALSDYNIGPYNAKRKAAGKRYVAKVARWRETLEEVVHELSLEADSRAARAGASASAGISEPTAFLQESVAL